MRGFSSLNSRTLTYTDNRSPDVKTNYAVAFDISSNETTNTFLMKRSIEIEEIVKPDQANLIITIDTRAVSGVLVEWDALPAGVTTIDSGGLYIVNGVSTASDWNDIKEPTITVPDGYQGTFFYIVRLEWTTPTGQEYVEYTVGEYIPVSVLVSEFALAATPNRIVGVSAILPAQFGFAAEIVDIPLLVTFGISCSINRIRNTEIAFGSTINVNISPIAFKPTSANLNINSSIFVYQPVQFIKDISYIRNRGNYIWQDNSTPVLQDKTPGSATFEFIISVDGNSVLSKDNGLTTSTSISYTGSLSSINSNLVNVLIYPNYNYNSSIKLTYTFKKNGTTLETDSIRLYAGALGSITPRYYQFAGAGNYYPTYEELQYGKLNVLLVGGGGGGGYSSIYEDGAGGGGGGAVLLKNKPIDYKLSYNIGSSGSLNNSGTGGNGGNTTVSLENSSSSLIWTHTATGGTGGGVQGGSSGYPRSPESTVFAYADITTTENTNVWTAGARGTGGAPGGAGSGGPSTGTVSGSFNNGGDSVRVIAEEVSATVAYYSGGGGGGASDGSGGGGFLSGATGASNFNPATIPASPGGGGGGAYNGTLGLKSASSGAGGTVRIKILGK